VEAVFSRSSRRQPQREQPDQESEMRDPSVRAGLALSHAAQDSIAQKVDRVGRH